MESLRHLDIKNNLYWSLVKAGYTVDIEKPLYHNITPDLTVEVNQKIVAVEIQKSPLAPRTILERMKAHTAAGAYTLWLIPPEILHTILKKKKWCELIQCLQYGIVFIPADTTKIQPARIDNPLNSKRKFINYHDGVIDIEDLILEKNVEYDINVAVCEEWWLETYLELYG